ncbi:hypothetical protein E4U41_004842 [Claviceps citrina]|nr:hypothetical protein E4U41_004842 [Claviceps citrina]
MLSNPPTSGHARQRQHRRQNSTPSAFEGMTISQMPNANNRRQAMAHRRGLSLDTRQNQLAQQTARQDLNKVRMHTNMTGLANTSQHHILQEAQQQRIQARPGSQQFNYTSMTSHDSENFLISPHGTPQSQRLDASCFDGMPVQFPYDGGQWSMMMQKNHDNFANNMAESKSFDLYSNDSVLSTPTFMNFQDSPAGQAWSICDDPAPQRNARRISNGIMGRVSKFEHMALEGPRRPTTPMNQDGNSKLRQTASQTCSHLAELASPDYLPPTPIETPHDRVVKQEVRLGRFSQDYDESMEETIRPTRSNHSGPETQSTFAEMRRQAEKEAAVPSPSRTTAMAEEFHNVQGQNPDLMSMHTLRNEFVEIEDQNRALEYESDASHPASDCSKRPSPETHDQRLFDEAVLRGRPGLPPFLGLESGESSRRPSSHRRTDSVASIVSAASIADIVIERTRTDTGVTLEEISQYILSPETTEGKWTCLFEECGKKFGRKENIKSHVQTHLNDRQYQCPTCMKCFVRQHDLKRHAKIHTGVKPYPCECGNSFARHDALTRHRQRGMCIGAFDGVVRKVVKRGRPRKNRPEMESRLDKSARTRKKNMSISSVSSLSGYSDSSAPNSPEADYNMVDDMLDLNMASNGNRLMSSMSTAPMPVFAPRNVNHGVTTSSPVVSGQSYVSPEAIMDRTSSHPATPAKSTVSRYSTPPELSKSSSPPPRQFFEMEPIPSAAVDELAMMSSSTTGMMQATDMNGTLPIGMSGQDDLLLQFSPDNGLAQLDRDPSLLLLTKFDDEFDETVSMFTNNDDMFFSNS